jgi:hypothetical protein
VEDRRRNRRRHGAIASANVASGVGAADAGLSSVGGCVIAAEAPTKLKFVINLKTAKAR